MFAIANLVLCSALSFLLSTQAQTPLSVRAIHASATTPAVDIYLNSTKVLSGFVFGNASAFVPVPEGTATLVVTPENKPDLKAIEAVVDLTAGFYYSALAIGTGMYGRDKLQPLLYADPGIPPAAGLAKGRIAHAAPYIPSVDVYLLAPGEEVAKNSPIVEKIGFAGVRPASKSPSADIPAGSYVIWITLSGLKIPVYKSAEISVTAGQEWLLAAVGVPPAEIKSKGLVQVLAVEKSGASAFLVNTLKH